MTAPPASAPPIEAVWFSVYQPIAGLGGPRWLLNKPELEREALAQVRARLDRVLEELVADGRVWLERPRVVQDLHALLAEIDQRAAWH